MPDQMIFSNQGIVHKRALGLFCLIKVEFKDWKQQRTEEDEKFPFNTFLSNFNSRSESQVAKYFFCKTT